MADSPPSGSPRLRTSGSPCSRTVFNATTSSVARRRPRCGTWATPTSSHRVSTHAGRAGPCHECTGRRDRHAPQQPVRVGLFHVVTSHPVPKLPGSPATDSRVSQKHPGSPSVTSKSPGSIPAATPRVSRSENRFREPSADFEVEAGASRMPSRRIIAQENDFECRRGDLEVGGNAVRLVFE